MPKKDFTQVAFAVVQQATGAAQKRQVTARQANSSKGGTKGGASRAIKLTPERRREIAVKAAKTRWQKTSPTEV